jgi:membrane protease YdiL (CAAX protease family)
MASNDPLSSPPDGAFFPSPPAQAESPAPPLPDLDGWSVEGEPQPVRDAPLPVSPELTPEPSRRAAPRPPHPNFWWGSLWCLGFFLFLNGTVLAALVVILVVSAVLSRDPGSYIKGLTSKGQPTDELMTLLGPAYLFGELASVAVALLVVRLVVGPAWGRRLSVRPPSLTQLVLALAALPALLTVPSLVHQLASLVLPSFNNLEANAALFSSWPLWFSVAVVGVLPGIGEELWCRGFLGRGFVGNYGWLAGVLLTSLWFGLLHVDPPYVVATFAMGIWLHYVYLTTRSLPLSMLLHALNNSLAVVFSKYSAEIKPYESATDHVVVLVAIGLLMAAVAWALFRGRARLVSTIDGGPPSWRPAFPGVEAPPPLSHTAVVRPGPGLLPLFCVAVGVAAVVGSVAAALYLGDVVP